MIRSRTVLALLAAVALGGCSPDRKTGPANAIASRLNEIADSSASANDWRAANALYTASAMVRAGGRVSTVTIDVDSTPYTFSAVGVRTTLSPYACQQLREMYTFSAGADTGVIEPPGFAEFDPCQPMQSLIAWEGDDMSRIAFVDADTGSSELDPYAFTLSRFYAEMYDRAANKEWWMLSGSQSNGVSGAALPCRTTPAVPEAGVRFTCRLVTLHYRFDAVLEEMPAFDFDSISVLIPRPSMSFSDISTWGDTTWTYTPGPTHTMSMDRHVINGLWMEVTRFDFTDSRFRPRMSQPKGAVLLGRSR